MKKQLILFVITALLMASCSSGDDITRDGRLQGVFDDLIGANIDPMQFWQTSVKMNVTVKADDPSETVTIEAYSIGMSVRTVFDVKVTQGSKTVTLTIPQGMGEYVGIAATCMHRKLVQSVVLSGSESQSVAFDLTDKKSVSSRAATDTRLYGSSILGGEYYNDINSTVWGNVMELVEWESVDASTRNEIVNYELVSNGKFEITMITGFGDSMKPHVLGYYYHSPGTYSDTKLVDIAECQVYDYYDGKAKTQYMLNSTFSTFNTTLYPDTWYDSNFDMNDDPVNGASTPNVERRNDDAYNSILVWKNMNNIVSRIRGLTFVVDVPKGMHLGFYLRLDEERCIDQFNRIVQMGMPDNIFPYTFTGYNFSAQAFNYSSTGKAKHRSWIHKFTDFTFMGMENIFSGGDLDCNDIVFGMTATNMDMVLPDITNPDIDTSEDPEIHPLTWTLAFEDVSRGADYDFNDAVIRIVPDFETQTCTVEAMACGTEAQMHLHYDGPNGDVYLGELHQMLTGKNNKTEPINTLKTTLSNERKTLGTVPWPQDYSFADDAKRFYIEVKRGDCTECSDVITLPTDPGRIPEAILVAGDWKWPLEGKKITDVYTDFKEWVQDTSNTNIWNWYTSPKANSYVTY